MLTLLLSDALPGWEEGPGLGTMSGRQTWLHTASNGGLQVDTGSHHLHPGVILFQHLLGQEWEPGVAAVHGSADALVEAEMTGREWPAILPHYTSGPRPWGPPLVGDGLTLSRQELE